MKEERVTMTVALKKLTPNLMVEHVNDTVAFYKDVLGFTLLASVPEEGEFNWAMMKRDAVEMMFQSRASLTGELSIFQGKEIGGSLTLYIDVENIKGLYTQAQNRVTMLHEMTTTFYGTREFTIQDCNGYILTFAEAETEAG
jgi:lactoylglutathione lyase